MEHILIAISFIIIGILLGNRIANSVNKIDGCCEDDCNQGRNCHCKGKE